MLLLCFTLSLSCVSQLRRSGRRLDALESTDSFFYKHQPSFDQIPVGEEILSSTRVVKDGRRGTELSNLEVHTVSTLLALQPCIAALLDFLDVALETRFCWRPRSVGARLTGVYIANSCIRCFGDKGDVEDITEG